MLDLLFDDFGGNFHSRMARDEARSAKDESQSSGRKVRELEIKLEKTLMMTEALWGIVKKSHKLEDSDLIALVKEIDLKDGNLNGKVQNSAPTKCGECGKTIQRGHTKCMYCSSETNESPFKR